LTQGLTFKQAANENAGFPRRRGAAKSIDGWVTTFYQPLTRGLTLDAGMTFDAGVDFRAGRKDAGAPGRLGAPRRLNKRPAGGAGGFRRPSKTHFSGVPRLERPLRRLASTGSAFDARIDLREEAAKMLGLLDDEVLHGVSPPSSSLLRLSLELSDTKVYEPCIRAPLGAASQFCEVVVLQSRTIPNCTALSLSIFRLSRRLRRRWGSWTTRCSTS
jgi:hypothetical protein